MSMGAYDEAEHERRERKASEVRVSDDDRPVYRGSLEFDAGSSADELLDQYEQITSS